MEIIKIVNIRKKHKCKYCKSIYTYRPSDVDWGWYNHIKCPVCKGIDEVSIFDKKIRERR